MLNFVSPNLAYKVLLELQGCLQNSLGKCEFTHEKRSQQRLMPSNRGFSFSSDPKDFGNECTTLHSLSLLCWFNN